MQSAASVVVVRHDLCDGRSDKPAPGTPARTTGIGC